MQQRVNNASNVAYWQKEEREELFVNRTYSKDPSMHRTRKLFLSCLRARMVEMNP